MVTPARAVVRVEQRLDAWRFIARGTIALSLLGGAARARGASAEPASAAPAPARRPAAPVLSIVTSNLEPTYLAPFPVVLPLGHSGIDPLWFEVNIAPHFLVAKPSWPVAFDLTPKILLRMYRENSSPVKTPSYMPRLTAYVFLSRELAEGPIAYASLTLSHHSNGQSGPFLNPDGSFNHDTGDFATNFLEAALDFAGGKSRGRWWVSPSIEWHPGWGQSEELRGRYGFWRAHAAFTGLRHLLVDDQLSFTLTATLDRLDLPSDTPTLKVLRRLPTSVRYVVKFPGLDLGIYLGAYVGPDYYNIWFDRVVTALQVGLAGDTQPAMMADSSDAPAQ